MSANASTPRITRFTIGIIMSIPIHPSYFLLSAMSQNQYAVSPSVMSVPTIGIHVVSMNSSAVHQGVFAIFAIKNRFAMGIHASHAGVVFVFFAIVMIAHDV